MITFIQKAIEITGSQVALAERAGCSQAAIWKLLHGRSKKVSAELAVAIERATDGKVTRHDLRPDLFAAAQVTSNTESAA